LGETLRRREFIAGLGGTAIGWPFAVRAQPGDRFAKLWKILLPTPENRARSQQFSGHLEKSVLRGFRDFYADLGSAADTVFPLQTGSLQDRVMIASQAMTAPGVLAS
jgi:hypothetical protein